MNIKTRFAIFLTKSTKALMRILNKPATYFPGYLAEKLDKDILKNLDTPNKIYGITGTNGKTTSSNILADTLDNLGVSYISNRAGANVKVGIISSLLDANKLFGGNNKEAAVLEIDELWTKKVLKDVKLTSLTITNLSQDYYERNANIFYVRKRIEQAITPGVKLILNASDPISSDLDVDNEKVYYDVLNIFNEKERRDSKINDMIYCPKCSSKIEWKFNRYHHYGKFICPNCGFTNPQADYIVESFDETTDKLIVNDRGDIVELPIVQKTIENVYNQISVYATLREDGYNHEDIAKAMEKIKITEDRYMIDKVGNKEIINLNQKLYNSVSISRFYDNISKYEAKGKTIIALSQNLESKYIDHRSPGWAFEIDFQYVTDEVDKIIILSKHYPELVLAMIMSGIDKDKIIVAKDEEDILTYIVFSKEETIFITYDIFKENIAQANRIANMIKEKVRG